MRAITSVVVIIFLWAESSIAQPEFDVFEKSITELQRALDEGAITSVNLVEQYLARIAAYDKQGPELNSIVRVNKRALQRAADLDADRSRSGARTQLLGLPLLL